MIHIITGLLHKAVLFKVTAVLLSLATAAGIFQLSSVFQVHALNVHGDSTNIQSTPPGQDKKVAGGGGGAAKPKIVNPKSNRPTTLTINTDIDFGTVFRGEELEGEFTISLTDSEDPTYVEYYITCEVTTEEGYLDLTDYLTIELDDGEHEGDDDNDTMASATLGEDEDVNDRWLVTLAPHPTLGDPPTGEYWSVITIHVDADPGTTEEP